MLEQLVSILKTISDMNNCEDYHDTNFKNGMEIWNNKVIEIQEYTDRQVNRKRVDRIENQNELK